MLGLELAVDDHFEDLLVGDAGAEDEGAVADAGCVGGELPRLKRMRQVTW